MTLAATQASGATVPPRHLTATVPQKALRDALNRVTRIIPSRSAAPGLTLVHIKLAPGRLTLKGASQDAAMQVSLEATTGAEGAFAAFAAPLQQIINNAPGENVTLEGDDKELQVTSGTFKTRLQLVDPQSAPAIDFPTDLASAITAEALGKLFDKTRFAAAVAEFQAVFRAVLLEFTGARTRAVATDGFRLAYYDTNPTPGLDGKILVPARLTYEITRAFTEGDVRIGISGKKLALENDTTKLTVNLMDGQFPDYERVIPAKFDANITLDSKALADALARVAVMSEKTANNRVDMHLKDGRLALSGEGQYGSAREDLDVTQEGPSSELLLAVNAKFLEEGIRPATGRITLNLNANAAPLTIIDHDDAGYLSMLVPLRTGN